MPFDPLYLNPGDLRQTVIIQSPDTVAPDAYGQTTATWTNILTARANIRAISIRESAQDSTLVSQVSHIITIRYPGSSIIIVPGYRVQYGSLLFKVQAIDNVLMRNRVVRLQCIAIDSND